MPRGRRREGPAKEIGSTVTRSLERLRKAYKEKGQMVSGEFRRVISQLFNKMKTAL